MNHRSSLRSPLFLALLLAAGCGITRDQFLNATEDARACKEKRECMVMDVNPCVCAFVVNESEYPRLADMSQNLWCGARVHCSPIRSVDCLLEKCTVTAYGPLPGSENLGGDGGSL